MDLNKRENGFVLPIFVISYNRKYRLLLINLSIDTKYLGNRPSKCAHLFLLQHHRQSQLEDTLR